VGLAGILTGLSTGLSKICACAGTVPPKTREATKINVIKDEIVFCFIEISFIVGTLLMT
jgi:hypothetical protein